MNTCQVSASETQYRRRSPFLARIHFRSKCSESSKHSTVQARASETQYRRRTGNFSFLHILKIHFGHFAIGFEPWQWGLRCSAKRRNFLVQSFASRSPVVVVNKKTNNYKQHCFFYLRTFLDLGQELCFLAPRSAPRSFDLVSEQLFFWASVRV